ncbi:DEAD/DEAH box helicase [Desulfatirhabdium butyrativorans]|uniref:DEAD/DEAH box helicase n=1 Tax=Desulfatirhabdium butyrativorans TaxID=340467 RepID=UPI0004277F56|nr:DEAD/DEAH box helicase [Desulfatirhabdium butyrativorans]
MKIEIAAKATITDAPQTTIRTIRKALSFPNPQYAENQRRGYSNWQTPRWIEGFELIRGGIVVPRGATGLCIHIAKQSGESWQVIDHRRTMPEVDFAFTGQLRDYQDEAVAAILRRDFGTLQAPTGSGKTTMALAVVAARRQPALVVCHTKELASQWRNRAASFLGMDKSEIGMIGGGKFQIGERLTIALVQSLYGRAGEVAPHVGFLIIDEVHHCPSRTFTEAVGAFDCKYQLGLSATPYRRDGLTRLIEWHIGPVVHRIDQQELMSNGSLVRAEVVQVPTEFESNIDASEYYSRALSELTEDPERNMLVVNTVIDEVQRSMGIVLVLSDRKAHCEEIRRLLSVQGIEAEVLTGDMANGKRSEVVKRMQAGEVKVVIGTGSLLGEGFDMPAVEALALASPIKFDGRLTQFVGRALRPSPGKTAARIIDFQDVRVPVLRAGALSRLRTYRRMAGISVADAD